MALQLVWEEFSINQSHGRMHLPCNGKSGEESGQTDNEIAVVNMDLESVGHEGTGPEEEELLGEEE
jgi:hypothetical protein